MYNVGTKSGSCWGVSPLVLPLCDSSLSCLPYFHSVAGAVSKRPQKQIHRDPHHAWTGEGEGLHVCWDLESWEEDTGCAPSRHLQVSIWHPYSGKGIYSWVNK